MIDVADNCFNAYFTVCLETHVCLLETLRLLVPIVVMLNKIIQRI